MCNIMNMYIPKHQKNMIVNCFGEYDAFNTTKTSVVFALYCTRGNKMNTQATRSRTKGGATRRAARS